MPRIESVLEYTAAPFSPADLDARVVVIMEMNDSYHIVLRDNDAMVNLWDSDSQEERGGIHVTRYDSLRDYFKAEHSCEDEMGNFSYGVPDTDGSYGIVESSEDEFFAYVNAELNKDSSIMGDGLLTISVLTGEYRDPEKLFNAFYMP